MFIKLSVCSLLLSVTFSHLTAMDLHKDGIPAFLSKVINVHQIQKIDDSELEQKYNAAMTRVANRAPKPGDDQAIKDYISTLGKGGKAPLGGTALTIAKISAKELLAQNPYYKARVQEKEDTETLLLPIYDECSRIFGGEQDPVELVKHLKLAEVILTKYKVDGPKLEKELLEAKALLSFLQAKDYGDKKKAYYGMRKVSKPVFEEKDLDKSITNLPEADCKDLMLDLNSKYAGDDNQAKLDILAFAVENRIEDLDHLYGAIASLSDNDARFGKDIQSFIKTKGYGYDKPEDFGSEIKDYGDLLKSKGVKAFHKAAWRKPEEVKNDAWVIEVADIQSKLPKAATNDLVDVAGLGEPELRKILRLTNTDAEIDVIVGGAKVSKKIIDKLAPEAKIILDAAGVGGYEDLINVKVNSELAKLDDYTKLSGFLVTTHTTALSDTGDLNDDLEADVDAARAILKGLAETQKA